MSPFKLLIDFFDEILFIQSNSSNFLGMKLIFCGRKNSLFYLELFFTLQEWNQTPIK